MYNRIIHHTYRIIHRAYGTESHTYTCNVIRTPISQPYTYTYTEKVNPFFMITNRAGGWVISKSFPLGAYGFKMRV